MHTFIINVVPLRHVSALKDPSSGTTTDTLQQEGQPDVKFSLMSSA
jgi:hypothetical protein